MRINKRFFLILFFMFFAKAAFPQEDRGTVVDKIIARVDNQIILKSELEAAHQEYLLRGGQEEPAIECQILEGMLINKMLLAKAETDSVTAQKEEVETYLNQRMQYMLEQAGSEERLARYFGKPIEQVKADLKENIEEGLIIEHMRNEVMKDIKVTPSEVKEFFNNIPADSLAYYPAEVEVRQIVKYPDVSKKQKLVVIEQLKALKKRIQQGEDFAKLAKEYSEDLGSADSGGELGFWKIGELTPAYEATVLNLAPGEVSEPVETEFGFHLIQFIERKGNRYNSRHILMKPASSELDVEEALSYLDSIRTSIRNGTTTFEKAAKEFSDDVTTASKGGLVTDNTGSVSIPIDELPAELFFSIDTLSSGAISKPLLFKTEEGKQAARILFLKDKIDPHRANLKQDYEKIYQRALDAKKVTALNAWFKDIKEHVFISIDAAYQHCQRLE